jgi:hypothetical protein
MKRTAGFLQSFFNRENVETTKRLIPPQNTGLANKEKTKKPKILGKQKLVPKTQYLKG